MNHEDSKELPSHSYPTSEQIEAELRRVRNQPSPKRTSIAPFIVLIITAAAVFLVNYMLLPVMKINGSSMEPTLAEGNITIVLKTDHFERGDICCFYYDDRILCKRIIGMPGDSVDIDEYGNVSVNGQTLSEPYVSEKSLENCDIEFPFAVPENMYFVLGDNRPVSDDSRTSVIGCVRENRMIGKVIVCIWPFSDFGIPE